MLMEIHKQGVLYFREYRRRVRLGLHVPKPINQRRAESFVPCSTCGTLVARSVQRRERLKHVFCSKDCLRKGLTGRPSARKKTPISRLCDQCGEIVTRPPWAMNRGRDHTFCNRQCFALWKEKNFAGESGPNWAGGHPAYYGVNWKRQRRRARQRDNYRCRTCGLPEIRAWRKLDVHHIVPFRFFGLKLFRSANKLKNLITLCVSCHKICEALSHNGEIQDAEALIARFFVNRR